MAPSDPIDSPVPEPWDSAPAIPVSEVSAEVSAPSLPTAAQGTPRVEVPAKIAVDPLIGTVLSDRYLVVSILGEGGMGAVYLAEHTHMRKRMAIKVLHPEMSHMPEVVARFEREAMAAAHIDHPNVATATDFGKLPDGSFFLALELIEGVSLRDVLAKGRLSLGRVLHMVRQVVLALVRAHGLNIVHRDLKPENIMLIDREGEKDFVKVLDFGIAKVPVGELSHTPKGDPAAPLLTQAGMVYGTPEYMAPEQALGQPIDARADLYALGVMTYEMLCGARPFEDESKIRLLGMHVTAPVPKMADKGGADVPPEVEAVVLRLLAKEASDRTLDAKTLLEELDGLQLLLVAAGRIEGRLPTAFRLSAPSYSKVVATPAPGETPLVPSSTSLAAFLQNRRLVKVVGGGLALLLVILILAVLVGKKPSDPTSGVVPVDPSAGPIPSAAGDPSAVASTGDAIIELDPTQPEPPVTDPKIKEGLAALETGNVQKGLELLEPYAEKPNCPPQVHRALMNGLKESDPKRAISYARKLVAKRPSERKAIDVLVVVRNLALGENAAENEAFALLTSGLGSSGPDVLYDIAYGDYAHDYPKASKRALKVLTQSDVRAKADPAAVVALDMRAAPGCELRKVLDRAGEAGDKRALVILQAVPKKPARKRDGYPGCVRGEAFDKAVSSIEARLKDGG